MLGEGKPIESIRCRELVVENEKGHCGIRLLTTKAGEGKIDLYNSDGIACATIEIQGKDVGNGANLRMVSPGNRTWLDIGLDDGAVGIEGGKFTQFENPFGEIDADPTLLFRLGCGNDGDSGLSLRSEENRYHLQASVADDGTPMFTMSDKEGNVRLHQAVDPNGNVFLELCGRNEQTAIGFEVDIQGIVKQNTEGILDGEYRFTANELDGTVLAQDDICHDSEACTARMLLAKMNGGYYALVAHMLPKFGSDPVYLVMSRSRENARAIYQKMKEHYVDIDQAFPTEEEEPIQAWVLSRLLAKELGMENGEIRIQVAKGSVSTVDYTEHHHRIIGEESDATEEPSSESEPVSTYLRKAASS